MRKRSKRTKIVRQQPFEHFDMDYTMLHYECEIFDLVNFLMHDRDRLCLLVLDARCKANTFALVHGETPCDIPYPLIAENLYDASYDDRPAMLRYIELFRQNE